MIDGLQALRTLLINDAQLSAMVGARVYPLERPQGAALPAVVIWQAAGDRSIAHKGPTGLADTTVQIDCYSEGGTLSPYAECKTIAAHVTRVLNGFRGTVDGVPLRGVFLVADRDNRQDGPQGVQRVVTVSLDFNVHNTEG